jgi:hypothetical protein
MTSTGTELSRSRDYLGENRRMIIGRSLAAAVAGAIPVPLLEEWLSSTIQRGTIRRIAEARGVDLDEEAVRAIADGPYQPPQWTEVAGGGIVYKLLARPWRRVLVAALAVRRVRAASRSFLIATLFDHYCARMHVGLGLDASAGAQLRMLMSQAIARAPGGLSRRFFSTALKSAARATIRAPVDLVDMATGGMVRKLLSRGKEVEAAAEVDEALERQIRERKSFLSRAAAALEFQLATEANPYLDRLLEDFEASWRNRL